MRDDNTLDMRGYIGVRGHWTYGCMEAFENAFKKEEVIHDAQSF